MTSPSSSPILLRCLDILKFENVLKNTSLADNGFAGTDRFADLFNSFEESFLSSSVKDDKKCVLPYFFPLVIRTLRRAFIRCDDDGCILLDPTTFDKTIMVRHIYNRHIFGQKYGQETSDGMSNVSINCDSIR